MKRFVSTLMLGAFNYIGKLLLTVVMVFVFLFALGMAFKVHALFLASKAQLRNPAPLYVGKPSQSKSRDSAVHSFWPEFPGSGAGHIQSSVINGVQILTEERESSAPVSEVLSYYREQMTARGWQDTTEETYNLQPEMRDQGGANNGLQDPQYLELYRSVMDSRLALRRGEWSLHIMAESSSKNAGLTAVKFYAAATPSVTEFVRALALSLAGSENRGQTEKTMDAVQQSGGQRYHTTIAVKNGQPAEAFEEALASLRQQEWQVVFMAPLQRARSGNFAMLSKGTQYAILCVTPSADGRAASVAFTEVTSE